MGLPCVRGKALALALLQGINLSHGCLDYTCTGVTVCNDEGNSCVDPADCTSDDITQLTTGMIRIMGKGCRVTLEQIMNVFPEAITKDGTEYILNNKITLRNGSILEIHGESSASSTGAAVSLLKLKSDATSSARIVAWDGKISIKDTAITSWDAEADGPDERLEGRAYIAALSGENSAGTKSWISRMDVEDSEISYLGNEGDYHNDIENDFGLVWKVEGYDDSNPDDSDLGLFDRVGVYGNLKRSNVHHNYMGAYCYGMKGDAEWSYNEVHNNEVVGINPQDNSDGMTIDNNHVHDNGWHGIEYSKRCQGALVTNNVVEDNARVGIFFHRSTDNAVAYGNTCRRNLEGDFGIMESMGAKVHDNIMEGGRYGIRLSLGAAENEIYDNEMRDSTDIGVFFFKGSDDPEASADWDGRPRDNIIENNMISNPGSGNDEGSAIEGVAIKESDDNSILGNTFVGIDELRFVDSFNTLVSGNVFPAAGVEFDLQEGSTLAAESQEDTA